MAKTKRSDVLTAAAEAIGATLGRVIGVIDKLHADHPHPVIEAQQALAELIAMIEKRQFPFAPQSSSVSSMVNV